MRYVIGFVTWPQPLNLQISSIDESFQSRKVAVFEKILIVSVLEEQSLVIIRHTVLYTLRPDNTQAILITFVKVCHNLINPATVLTVSFTVSEALPGRLNFPCLQSRYCDPMTE